MSGQEAKEIGQCHVKLVFGRLQLLDGVLNGATVDFCIRLSLFCIIVCSTCSKNGFIAEVSNKSNG